MSTSHPSPPETHAGQQTHYGPPLDLRAPVSLFPSSSPSRSTDTLWAPFGTGVRFHRWISRFLPVVLHGTRYGCCAGLLGQSLNCVQVYKAEPEVFTGLLGQILRCIQVCLGRSWVFAGLLGQILRCIQVCLGRSWVFAGLLGQSLN